MKKTNIFFKLISLFGIILILFLLFSPEVNRAGFAARRISCTQNIIQLELALRSYQNINNDLYPASSGEKGLIALDKYINRKASWKCPGDKEKKLLFSRIFEKHTNKDSEFYSDYIYLGGFKEDDTPRVPILFDKIGNHKDYCNVLYSNRTREALNLKYISYDDLISFIDQKEHYSPEILNKIKQKLKEALQNNKEMEEANDKAEK